jgi:hypothetical protein
VPIAVSCALLPSGNEELLAATAIETKAAVETLRFVLPLIFDEDAETPAVPTPLASTVPPLPTETTPGAELVHVTDPVMSFVVVSV